MKTQSPMALFADRRHLAPPRGLLGLLAAGALALGVPASALANPFTSAYEKHPAGDSIHMLTPQTGPAESSADFRYLRDTWIEINNLYFAGNTAAALAKVQEIWAQEKFALGDRKWRYGNGNLTSYFQPATEERPEIGHLPSGWGAGEPAFYPSLRLWTDLLEFMESRDPAQAAPQPITLSVILVSQSSGKIPRSKAELQNGGGVEKSRALDPRLRENNYRIVHQSLRLFRDYVFAISQGTVIPVIDVIELDYNLPITIGARRDEGGNIKEPITQLDYRTPNWPNLVYDQLSREQKKKSDLRLIVYPSPVPDTRTPGHFFKDTDFLTGGIVPSPNGGRGPDITCDDRWLIYNLKAKESDTVNIPYGQQEWTNLERQIYLPQWLQHEFFHHLFFGVYPELNLETDERGHDWFDRDFWPADFVGEFEPDYYHETVFRRMQTPVAPRSLGEALGSYGGIADPALLPPLDATTLAGRYNRTPEIENPWHTGLIEPDPDGNPDHFVWVTNEGKIERKLVLDREDCLLQIDHPEETGELNLKFDWDSTTGRYRLKGFQWGSNTFEIEREEPAPSVVVNFEGQNGFGNFGTLTNVYQPVPGLTMEYFNVGTYFTGGSWNTWQKAGAGRGPQIIKFDRPVWIGSFDVDTFDPSAQTVRVKAYRDPDGETLLGSFDYPIPARAGGQGGNYVWYTKVSLAQYGTQIRRLEVDSFGGRNPNAQLDNLVLRVGPAPEVPDALTEVDTGTTERVNDTSFSDADNGLIATDNGGVRQTSDGGQTWTDLETGLDDDLYAIEQVGSSIFIAGANGLICVSRDNGANWEPFNTGTTETFTGLSFSSSTNGFAVGTNGTICIYNGSTWVAQNPGIATDFNEVKIVRNTAWAVGSGGVICRYDGTAWVDASPGVSEDFYSVSFLREGLGIAVGANGLLCRYDGSEWVEVRTRVTTNLRSVLVVDENTICIVGDGGVLVESYDGGRTWQGLSVGAPATLRALTVVEGRGFAFGSRGAGFRTSVASQPSSLTGVNTGTARQINGASFSASQNGIIVTNGGGVRVTSDGGRTWTDSLTNVENDIYAIRQVGNVAYLAGENGLICISTDNGVTWQAQDTGDVSATFTALSFTSSTNGFAVGTGGTICFYNGTSWVEQATGRPDVDFYGISTGGGTPWAVGSGGVICRYNGSSWEEVSVGITTDFYGVSFLREDLGFAVGAEGVICRYNGTEWMALNSGTRATFRSVVIVDESTIVVSGDGGIVCQSTDGGQTWQNRTVGSSRGATTLTYAGGRAYTFGEGGTGYQFTVPRQPAGLTRLSTGAEGGINGAWFTSSRNGFLTTNGGGVRVTSDGGRTWSTLNTGVSNNITAIRQVGSETFLVGANGLICRSTDNGETWESYAVGTEETLTALSFTSTTSGFAVGTRGTICIYDGTRWVEQASGTDADFNGVSAVGNTAWAVGSGGVICVYRNGSWEAVQTGVTADFYGVSFLREDLGFAVGAGGLLCRYNGTEWVALSSGTTTALRTVLVLDDRTILATGDGGLVCRSTDGGQTWQVVSVGTSQDLVALSASGSQAYTFGRSGAAFRFTVPRLLAYWDFDDPLNPGVDQSGNTPNAVLSNSASLTEEAGGFSGRSGDHALDLGGYRNGGRASVPAGSHFEMIPQDNAYTIVFWQLNRSPNTSTSSFWFIAPDSSHDQRGIQAHVPWGNGTIFFDQSGCCEGPQRLTKAGGVVAGEWQHYAFRCDGDGNREIFVDGVRVAQAGGAAPLAAFNGVLTIGSDGTGDSSLNGLIDEFAVFAGDLDDDEIARLAAGGRVLPKSHPQQFYFDVDRDGNLLTLTWESYEGYLYNVRHSNDLIAGAKGPIAWPIYPGYSNIEPTPPFNTLTIPRDGAARYFVIEAIPAPGE